MRKFRGKLLQLVYFISGDFRFFMKIGSGKRAYVYPLSPSLVSNNLDPLKVYFDLNLGVNCEFTLQEEIIVGVSPLAEAFPYSPNILFFDLETSPSTQDIYLAVGCIDEKSFYISREKVIREGKGIAQSFFENIDPMDVDLIVGFNSSKFDLPLLLQEVPPCRPHNISFQAHRGSPVHPYYLHYDVLPTYRNLHFRSCGLSNLARVLLNESKEDLDSRKMDELWKNQRERVISYCLKDVLLTQKLGRSKIETLINFSDHFDIPLGFLLDLDFPSLHSLLLSQFLSFRKIDAKNIIRIRTKKENTRPVLYFPVHFRGNEKGCFFRCSLKDYSQEIFSELKSLFPDSPVLHYLQKIEEIAPSSFSEVLNTVLRGIVDREGIERDLIEGFEAACNYHLSETILSRGTEGVHREGGNSTLLINSVLKKAIFSEENNEIFFGFRLNSTQIKAIDDRIIDFLRNLYRIESSDHLKTLLQFPEEEFGKSLEEYEIIPKGSLEPYYRTKEGFLSKNEASLQNIDVNFYKQYWRIRMSSITDYFL